MFQREFRIEKPSPDLLTLTKTFCDASVSRNLFFNLAHAGANAYETVGNRRVKCLRKPTLVFSKFQHLYFSSDAFEIQVNMYFFSKNGCQKLVKTFDEEISFQKFFRIHRPSTDKGQPNKGHFASDWLKVM